MFENIISLQYTNTLKQKDEHSVYKYKQINQIISRTRHHEHFVSKYRMKVKSIVGFPEVINH